MDKKKIAIIGGGFTGLTAALRLAQQNKYEIIVLEKSNFLGGLASGFSIGGTSLEKTYHHIFTTDEYIINLAKELGIEQSLMWKQSSMAAVVAKKVYPFTTAVDLLKFSALPFLSRIRAGVVALYLRLTKNWQRLVPISAADWMLKWSGKKVAEVFWIPLLKSKFDRYWDKASMAWLWGRIYIRSQSRKPGIPGEALGYFKGGFWVVVQALQTELERRGVKIYTQTGVESLNVAEDGVELTFGGKTEKFNAVLATLPSHHLEPLLKDKPPQAVEYFNQLNSILYLGAVCAVFASTQDLSQYYWHSVSDADAPFVVFINQTRLLRPEDYGGLHVYYMAKYVPHDHVYFTQTDEEIYKLWFSYLKSIFPKFEESQVTERHLFRFKFAQHVADIDYLKKVASYQTPFKGVYLSNFSQIFPEERATNFAVREGNKVAALINKDLSDNEIKL